ncbi:MAG TPA: HTH domain-containing protein [Pirellulales bacterium]|jgi:predicted DNA-binding transcriptional regulator YafY|nr:HTH domain-containing protein [Pirellulales bacterium]
MATSDRLARLLQLNSLIESGVRLTVRQIAESYHVSRRTIIRDVKALQTAGIPIATRESGGYEVVGVDNGQSLPLREDEVVALLLVATQFRNTEPLSTAIQGAIGNIIRRTAPTQRNELRRLIELCMRSAVRAPSSTVNEQAFKSVVTAIRKGLQIRLYGRLTDTGVDFTTKVTPERLYWQGGTWILIGRSSIHRKTKLFRLDLVSKAEAIDEWRG